MSRERGAAVGLGGALAAALLAWGAMDTGAAPRPRSMAEPRLRSHDQAREPELRRVNVISSRPHDRTAYTQGLVLHAGELYESAGDFRRSSLRRVDPLTGVVKQRLNLPDTIFAEGLALVGDRLIQLTWQNRVAFVYDRATFREVGRHSYDTDGWGLCYDGTRLVMTDGTSTMYFRDPDTFEAVGQVEITSRGRPLREVNELECVGDTVYGNVFRTDTIVEIDPRTGEVVTEIDAAGLLTPEEQVGAYVLNGIAWDPATGHFLVTGKDWPRLFEVTFDPVPPTDTAVPPATPTPTDTAVPSATPVATETATPTATPTLTPRPVIYVPALHRPS